MHFFEVLAQTIGWLVLERRVSYEALKRQFALDDADIEALKTEIIEIRALAHDHEGRLLVWVGERLTSPHSLHRAASHPLTHDKDAPQVSQLPMIGHAEHAERRQLTVMFCDVVESTSLSRQLDPEDLREVIRAYQETTAGVVKRYAGHMAQYLGDGVLVYFGYPLAHEDDAERAVRTSLEIIEAIKTLRPHLEAEKGIQIAVRIGIHTGLVVIGEMGGGDRQERLALGETPNIAARLEGLAAPNTVVISAFTARLIRETFALEDLGEHELKGVTEPMQAVRVLSVHQPSIRREDGAQTRVPTLVGRDEEMGLLRRRWEQSKGGLGQVVLMSGEAGIGKSSLVRAVRTHVSQDTAIRIAFRCSPYHTNSALYPVIAHLEQVLGFAPDDPAGTKLDKLEQVLRTTNLSLEESVPLLAPLLSVPLEERYPAPTLSPQQQRQQTLDTLVGWLLEEAERQPVLAVWEDLHWADPSTLEALGLVLEQTPTVPMLHVLTYRPEFELPWPTRSHMTSIILNRLERPQVAALITHLVRGKALPGEVIEHVIAKADGIPFYAEELTKMLLASDLLREEPDHYELTGALSSTAIPDTLQDSLMARLDQLKMAKNMAQVGAVLGREFSYDMLQAVMALDDETLQAGLAKVVEAELLYQRGRPPRATYIFKHALIQDVAYASLLRRTRQHYHGQVVAFLESQPAEIIDRSPDVMARHCMEAGLYDQSARYWHRAGQDLTRRCANREAVTCFEQALQALSRLPESQHRLAHEVDLMLALRAVLFPLREFHRVFTSLQRAERLAERLQDHQRLGRVLGHQGRLLWATRQHQQALEVGQRVLDLAMQDEDIGMTVIAKDLLCRASYYLSDYPCARTLCAENMDTLIGDLERESFGIAGFASVHARRWYGHICAETGDFSEGKRRACEAVKIAEAAAHPHTLISAYYTVGTLDLRQGHIQDAAVALEHALTICLKEDIRVWFMETASALGAVYALLGRTSEALELQEQSVEHHEFDFSRRLIALGETYLQVGRLKDARVQADQGVRLAKDANEAGFLAWGLRLLGDIAAHRDAPDIPQAHTYYQQTLARVQGLGMRPLQAHCHLALGTLYVQTRQAEQARVELARARSLYHEMEMTFWLPKLEAALVEAEKQS